MTKTVDDPAGAIASATATCATGKVVLGGGVQTTADAQGSVVQSAAPKSKTAYRVTNANRTGADEKVTALAVCAKAPAGYRIVSQVVGGAGTAFLTGIACPAGTAVVGGGVSATPAQPKLALAETINDGAGLWRGELIDPGSTTTTVTTKVICAA